jgi:Fe-S-cluster containining protein
MDPISLNKQKAYLGELGQKREAFCAEYIDRKRAVFEQFRASQAEIPVKTGEEITCHKGCSLCCAAYMQANIQECEAIVYYLYQHEDVLASFLAKFPSWRQALKDNGDIFKELGELWQEKNKPGSNPEAVVALQQAEKRYLSQKIMCPFLEQDSCSIYEVRPLTCAALVATTPPERCVPGTPNSAKMYVTSTPLLMDTSFYFNKLDAQMLAFMPLVVYGILEGGYEFLANIPGLEGLEEVAGICGSYKL